LGIASADGYHEIWLGAEGAEVPSLQYIVQTIV
jgi:hypothetical protein